MQNRGQGIQDAIAEKAKDAEILEVVDIGKDILAAVTLTVSDVTTSSNVSPFKTRSAYSAIIGARGVNITVPFCGAPALIPEMPGKRAFF